VLALVALVLGVFVVRPILTSSAAARALPPPGPQLALPGGRPAPSRALDGEVEVDYLMPDTGQMATYGDAPEREPEADPATRLRRLIETRQTESIEILRGWMEQEEERV
jgi:flagellar M-ring protein FliF